MTDAVTARQIQQKHTLMVHGVRQMTNLSLVRRTYRWA